MKSGGECGGEIHPQASAHQKDGFTSWLRAEFVVANAIIDCLCHHLHYVGKPGEYDSVIGCIQQRRVSWNHVLHFQPFFPFSELIYALQQVEWNKHQQAIDQWKEGELGHDLRKSNDKRLPDVSNAVVGGSLKTRTNPNGADNPQTGSRLKDVKIENNSNYEGSCDLSVANNGRSIQNKNEESLTNSPKTFHVVETNQGNTGCIYVKEISSKENPKLMSPVNDLRATGEHIQIAGQNIKKHKANSAIDNDHMAEASHAMHSERFQDPYIPPFVMTNPFRALTRTQMLI